MDPSIEALPAIAATSAAATSPIVKQTKKNKDETTGWELHGAQGVLCRGPPGRRPNPIGSHRGVTLTNVTTALTARQSRELPLAGVAIVVTRVVAGAAPLVKRIRADGGNPLPLPGLTVRATRDAAPALRRLAMLDTFDVLVFTSPLAVRFAFRLAPRLAVGRAGVVGIGPGTRRALQRRGIGCAIPTARIDSEGVLDMPVLADVKGRRIALVGAPGGRDLIAPKLRLRGAEVAEIHVYERDAPRLTQRHFAALAAVDDPLITLVSSAQALGNLVQRLPPALLVRLRHQVVVVSSGRLENLAHELGFEDVLTARSAAPDDLLHAAARALARHRL